MRKRRTKRNKKANNQRVHAFIRVKERYGFWLTKEDYNKLVQQIQSNKSIPLKKDTNRVSKHIVFYNDVLLYVCYDRVRKTIVTFLSPDMFETNYGIKMVDYVSQKPV